MPQNWYFLHLSKVEFRSQPDCVLPHLTLNDPYINNPHVSMVYVGFRIDEISHTYLNMLSVL